MNDILMQLCDNSIQFVRWMTENSKVCRECEEILELYGKLIAKMRDYYESEQTK